MADRDGPDDPRPSRGRRPSGEGWDDGTGPREPRSKRSGDDRPGTNRPGTKRPGPKRSGSKRSGSKGKRPGPKGSGTRRSGAAPPGDRSETGSGRAGGGASSLLARLPKWALPAAVVVVVLLLVVAFLVGQGDDNADSGSCLSDLSHDLPRSTKVLHGSDLVAARSAGYQDGGSLEDLGDSQRSTGAIPDELTQRYRYGRLISEDQFVAQTGVAAGDIDCSLSSGDASVMSGTFDTAQVNGSSSSNEGLIEASEDRLGLARGHGDPAKLLEPRDDDGIGGDESVAAVLASLRDQGSYSVLIQVAEGDDDRLPRVAGFGVAKADDGDDRALVVAWSFVSADAAQAGRTQVVERVNDALRGNTSITASDLEVDDRLVQAKIDTRKAPDLLGLIIARTDLIPGD